MKSFTVYFSYLEHSEICVGIFSFSHSQFTCNYFRWTRAVPICTFTWSFSTKHNATDWYKV